ncbi:thiol reductant ABC exporter subunit CydD [Chlorobium phaeovibrioides]|uniref:Thiol reductant ABC exporter subunit CydD n=1 Tax=Chlorobium phaeovibrioides TaxID=1094 RepID=A0ABW9URC9_CHLPH|nr:thiol reductant ABC exporter subunit CydD [Chlorobium phaeovibrioides]MWV54668.1 thiol reductant ABC exporter subunit CydD [Chlorobium phaeovibrioides]RTY34854.1 thiol reductant ABC exporter subunit CydD [Chlorobium phaeovibrioides]
MNRDRRLFGLIRENRTPFVLSFLSGALAGLMMIGQAFSLSTAINAAFILHKPLSALKEPIALFALFSVLRMLLTWAGHTEANRGTLQIRKKIFSRLAATVARRGPLLARSMQSGKLSLTMQKGVGALDAYFSQFVPQLFLAVAIPVLILIAVFPTDLISGIILLVTAPLIPVFMALIGKRAGALTDRQWESLSRMSGYFLDMLQGMTTLKIFARSRIQHDAIREAGENFRAATMKVLKIAFLSSLTLELVGTIGTALIAVGIGVRLLSGSMAFQSALFVLILTPDFYLPLRQLGQKFHAGMEGESAAKDIFAILEDESPEPRNGTATPERKSVQSLPISYLNVSYSYPRSSTQALKAATCCIPAGTTTAIIGPSGSGKSTLLSMILRFADPDSGTISIGTDPLESFSIEAWQKLISWVPQHPFLFNETLRENILMANREASLEELQRAIVFSGLEGVAAGLPQGLDTPIGEEGARLSGGEAQRVALARAFIKDSPILVLDEPTSHTDPELEASLSASIKTLMENRTTIIIAHRLETVRNAGHIIMLQDGAVMHSGTHEEMVRINPFYQKALAAGEDQPS